MMEGVRDEARRLNRRAVMMEGVRDEARLNRATRRDKGETAEPAHKDR